MQGKGICSHGLRAKKEDKDLGSRAGNLMCSSCFQVVCIYEAKYNNKLIRHVV